MGSEERREILRLTRGRRGRLRWAAGLAVAFASSLIGAPVLADPAAQARFHDENARAHYQSGRYDAALREFFLEQRASPNPRIAFNIALCFQSLKRPEEAFQYFGEYLGSPDDDAERRRYAEESVAKLEPTLALVSVQSTPAGARIFVDRKELGSYGLTPRLIAVAAGEHEVFVELEGYREASGKVVARRGARAPIALTPVRIVGHVSVTSAAGGKATLRNAAGETVASGALPLELDVPSGTYEVRVQASGHVPWTGLAAVEVDRGVSVNATPQVRPALTGDITVTSNVPGALVELNGEPAGFTPTVLSGIQLGEQQLRVGSASKVPWAGPVIVKPEERAWLTVSLEDPPTTHRSPATWIVGGIGGAALIAGGALAIMANSAHEDFEEAPPDSDRTALRDRGIALNTASDVVLLTGGIAAVAAVITYFVTAETRGEPSSASVARSKR